MSSWVELATSNLCPPWAAGNHRRQILSQRKGSAPLQDLKAEAGQDGSPGSWNILWKSLSMAPQKAQLTYGRSLAVLYFLIF